MPGFKWTVTLIIAISFFGLAGCANTGFFGSDPLSGTRWEVVQMDGQAPIPSTTITIEFENGELGARAGCNSIFGSYSINGSEIDIDSVGMTEMACMEPEGVMEQEQEFAAILGEVTRFEQGAGTLLLGDPSGEHMFLILSPQ